MRQTLAALPLTIALLAACTAMPPAREAPSLDGTSWVLADLPGVPLAADAPASVSFDGGRAAGGDGCNRFTVGYTTKGSAIDFPQRAASTQMACPPPVMKQADAFMAALAGARSYRIAEGRLQLLAADGTVRATLVAQAQTLAGNRWNVTAVNNGKGGVASLVSGSTVTVAFAADGKAAGSAGCNQYTAGYQADASRLRFTAPASTRRMCAGEDLMQQEHNFLKALESVATMRMEGNRLEMRDAKGALMISATKADGN